MNSTIILASQSPRRKEILSWLIPQFEVIPGHIDEEKYVPLARTPEELVVKLAGLKAKAVVQRPNTNKIQSDFAHGQPLILAADTVVIFPNAESSTYDILGKPVDIPQARLILERLRGQTHLVYTGLCLLDQVHNVQKTDFVKSQVTFTQFSDDVLERYLATHSSLDKAGAYGIQDLDPLCIGSIEGSLTNIIGLPVQKVVDMLTYFDVILKPDWKEKVKQETGYSD